MYNGILSTFVESYFIYLFIYHEIVHEYTIKMPSYTAAVLATLQLTIR